MSGKWSRSEWCLIMGTSSGFIGVFKSVADTMGGGLATYGAIMGASVIGGLRGRSRFLSSRCEIFPGSCNRERLYYPSTVPDLRRYQFFRRRKRREGLWIHGESSSALFVLVVILIVKH